MTRMTPPPGPTTPSQPALRPRLLAMSSVVLPSSCGGAGESSTLAAGSNDLNRLLSAASVARGDRASPRPRRRPGPTRKDGPPRRGEDHSKLSALLSCSTATAMSWCGCGPPWHWAGCAAGREAAGDLPRLLDDAGGRSGAMEVRSPYGGSAAAGLSVRRPKRPRRVPRRNDHRRRRPSKPTACWATSPSWRSSSAPSTRCTTPAPREGSAPPRAAEEWTST